MCHALNVSRSGYYKWLHFKPGIRERKQIKYESLVKDTYEEFKAMYGYRRITEELNDSGYKCSVNFIAKIMKKHNIKAHNGKGFKYPRKGSKVYNISENILWRDFKASKPNEKWTTDITYIWVKDQWMYLATVMDLYSRKIVGWSLDLTMTEDLVIEALSVAFARRNINKVDTLILHSDRGVQYRSQKYIDFAVSKGCQMSMSRRGNCWDNAPMESFFSRLKVELVYSLNFTSISEAKTSIFEYIEVFYNRKRKHSSIGYKSPVNYENETLKRCS